jgi:hypothetical protein
MHAVKTDHVSLMEKKERVIQVRKKLEGVVIYLRATHTSQRNHSNQESHQSDLEKRKVLF